MRKDSFTNSENVPVSSEEKAKAALTELFKSVKNANTPVIIERIVTEIDDIVKVVRFPGWQKRDNRMAKAKFDDNDKVHSEYFSF